MLALIGSGVAGCGGSSDSETTPATNEVAGDDTADVTAADDTAADVVDGDAPDAGDTVEFRGRRDEFSIMIPSTWDSPGNSLWTIPMSSDPDDAMWVVYDDARTNTPQDYVDELIAQDEAEGLTGGTVTTETNSVGQELLIYQVEGESTTAGGYLHHYAAVGTTGLGNTYYVSARVTSDEWEAHGDEVIAAIDTLNLNP